jgi:uncharacterized damage-inducible protein DinB
VPAPGPEYFKTTRQLGRFEQVEKYRARVASSNSLNLWTAFSFFKRPFAVLLCIKPRKKILARRPPAKRRPFSCTKEGDNLAGVEENMGMAEDNLPEPWLRATLSDVPAVPRAVLHALELAKEDLRRWCGELTDDQLNARLGGIAPVAFHLRHIARSIDRLLTYAEGGQLSSGQIAALKAELDPGATRGELFAEIESALARSAARIRAIDPSRLDEPRKVGKKELPTTVGGLLVHVADHTQRHVGQAVTTAKIVMARLAAPRT